MDNQTEVSIKFNNKINGESNLKEYEQRLQNIYSFIGGLSSNQTTAMNKVSNVVNELKTGTQETNQEIKQMSNQFNMMFNVKSISAFTKTVYSLFKALTNLSQQSVSYIENVNLLEVAYSNANETIEESSKRIEDFIDHMADVYGLDESRLTRQFGIFKQLANAMKLPTETAENLSEIMVKMTNDIASLYNLDLDRASNALQSALAGQVRPIRSATGADITEKTLQTTVDQLGLDRSISQLSYVEKRLVMVISLTQQLKNSQGDYARTIESASNQIRVMKEQWQRLTRAVGNVFMPLLQKILPWVNAILIVLTEIFNLIAKLLGFEMPEFDYSGITGASDAVSDLMEGMDSAGASADTLKGKMNGLRGFDKLNVINTPSGAGSSIVSAGGIDPNIMNAFNEAFDKYNDMLDDVNMKAKQIANAILDWLGFTDGTYKNLKLIGILLGAWAGLKIFSLFKSLFGANTINAVSGSGGLLGAFRKLNDFLSNPSNIVGSLKSIGNGFVNFLEHPITTIGTGIKNLVNKIPPAFRVIGGAISAFIGWKGLADKFKDSLNGIEVSAKDVAINVAEMVGGGALIGSVFGPVGALFGAIAGGIGVAITAIVEYNKAQDELLKREVFGKLRVSYEQWLAILENSGIAVTDYSAKYAELRNGISQLNDSISTSIDELSIYGVRFGILTQQITEDDLEKIKSSVNSTSENALDIIEKSTNYGITMLTDYFANSHSLHESYQKTLLDNITKTDELQKEEIQTAQNAIIEIYTNAYNEHRNLNDQEYQQVKENLEKIKNISIQETSATEAEIYYLNQKYSDKNSELDEQSYYNWKNARDKFQEEQLDKIQKYYDEQYAFAVNNKDKLFANEEDKDTALKTYLQDLNTQRDNMTKDVTTKIQNMETELTKGLKKKYQELNSEHKGMTKEQKENAQKQKKFIEEVMKALGDEDFKARKTTENAIKMRQELDKQFRNPIDIKLNLKMDTSNFDNKLSSVKRELNNIQASYKSVGKADGGVFVNGHWQPVSAYASGGLPPVGQMFVARENGPELVGQLSGHTAVMNNDQIVSSVSNGVYRAVRDAGGSGQPVNATFVIQVGSKEVAREVITDLQGMAKTNGKPITIGG